MGDLRGSGRSLRYDVPTYGGKIGGRSARIKRGFGKSRLEVAAPVTSRANQLTSGVSRTILLHNSSAANTLLTLVSRVAPKSLDLVRIPKDFTLTGSS